MNVNNQKHAFYILIPVLRKTNTFKIFFIDAEKDNCLILPVIGLNTSVFPMQSCRNL